MPVRSLLVLLCALALHAETFRGILTQRPGAPPAIETTTHKLIALEGDEPTLGVLNDKRLAGSDLEVHGVLTPAGRLKVDPIHTKALFVHRHEHRKTISYWCELCSIRSYTPGICWCCQQETELDLRDPDAQ